MNWLSGVIQKQGSFLLENNRQAVLLAVALSLLSYTSWLSVAIIALITLRKGWQQGAMVFAPVVLVNMALGLASTTATIALINALLTFMPCYLAAGVLRMTMSWRAVAGVFFLQIMVVVLLLQTLMPEYIMAQYLYMQNIFREVQTDSTLLAFINDKTGLNQLVLANYLLGLQAVGVIFSALLSLMFARSVQSQLFYPGGFKREMLQFRGDKIGLLLMVILLVAASQQSMLAISLVPMLIFYFLLAGLSLSFNIFAKQKMRYSIILLVATLFLLPFIMLPVYVIFGSLDSLFNFRLYLPGEAAKTI